MEDTVGIETLGSFRGYVYTCGKCGVKLPGIDKMDAYYAGARHKRESH